MTDIKQHCRLLPVSFADYLLKVRREDFLEQLELCCRVSPRAVRTAVGNPGAESLHATDACLLRVASVPGQSLAATRVDVIVRGRFSALEAGAPKSLMGLFRFCYFLDLRPCRGECLGPVIVPLEATLTDAPAEPGALRSDAWLLPMLKSENYDAAAYHVLRRWQPASLRGRRAVNGIALAIHMGLRIRRVRLEEGSCQQGRIIFDRSEVLLRDRDGKAYRETVEPMTVLINTDLCRSPIAENTTLVHECCHVFLDLPFFLLQRMAERHENTLRDFAGRDSPLYTPTDRMERQAEKLTACVLLGAARTRQEIGLLYARFGGAHSPENTARVLGELARSFGVSRTMARIRMTELGFPEAEGVFGWLDGRRIPDYGCGGEWVPGRHYVISFAAASRLHAGDPVFAETLRRGDYVYVEGHFCRRDERYVTLRRGKLPVMTDYARRHVDECCIPFVGTFCRSGGRPYTSGQAARMQNVMDRYERLRMDDTAGNAARTLENRKFVEEAKRWNELRRELAVLEDPREAVRRCRTALGLSQQALADLVGVHRKTLDGWFRREMSVPHAVALCVAMQLRSDVARELLRIFECRWRGLQGREVYEMMLEYAQVLTVWRCNEILGEYRMPPLQFSPDNEPAAM